jgi:hypothetical protein
MLKLEQIPIKYHKCDDGKWAAHTTLFDPRDKKHYMQVGFGRRKEHARKDLENEIVRFIGEIINDQEATVKDTAQQTSEGAAT